MKKFLYFFFVIATTFTISGLAAEDFSLNDIYKNDKEFHSALTFNGLEAKTAALEGKLSDPKAAKEAITLFDHYNNEFERLFAYSYLSCAADTKNTAAKERYTVVRNAAVRYEAAVAPLRKELSELNGSFHPNDGVLRLLSQYAAFPSEVASIVLNADFNPPEIIRPDGTAAAATNAELALAMSSNGRDYRKAAYEGYYSTLLSHRNTLAASLEAHIAGRLRQAELRDANMSHERQIMLSKYQMPPEAADVLLKKVFGAAEIQGRAAELAAKSQGVDKLAPYDIEPPSGSEAGRYSLDDAKQLVLNALEPLGQKYHTIAERILNSGHINAATSPNKQSGAFCVPAGADTDPYIHINFNGSLASVSTLAHELGHAVHFVLSREQQPANLAQPTLAVTETAAIFNEIMLARYMMAQAGDAIELQCAADAYADLISGSLFNQARLFAFERAAFISVNDGGSLTADKCDSIWNAVSEPFRGKYTEVPECARSAWASVPHLYRDFYVINYAFSVAAAESLAESALENGANSYLDFLSSGSSKPAYDLFRNMGVDFLNERAYNDVIERLKELYDILEVRVKNAA